MKMRYVVVAVVVICGCLGLYGLMKNTSTVVVSPSIVEGDQSPTLWQIWQEKREKKRQEQEKTVAIQEKTEVIQEKTKAVQAKVSSDIPKEVIPYLKDDVVEIKEDATLEEVDRIWGKPDEVEREYVGEDIKIDWDYGNYWKSKSKLKGMFYYKYVIFKNDKMQRYHKEGDVDVKTHTRDSVEYISHLDVGTPLKRGMTKEQLYNIWGLPQSIEVTYSGRYIDTEWDYKKDGSLSHYARFHDNKLYSWGDY
jgi:hypothetical protein